MFVRAATRTELAYLQGRLASTDREQVELGKSIVYVAIEENVILGFVAGGLIWRVEPLMVFPEFQRKAPPAAQKRAAYLLGKAMDDYIMASPENRTGIRRYFAFVCTGFERLAVRFGLRRLPEDEIVLERSLSDES